MVIWLIILTAGEYRLLALLSILFAISPDSVWFYRHYREKVDGFLPKRNKLTDFHAKIQWGERPWGWILEISWFAAMILTYSYLVYTFVISK